MNRGDVLTACFRDIQRQRSIRMEFVMVRYRSVRIRRKNAHDSQDFCKCSSTDVFGTKARMDTYRI